MGDHSIQLHGEQLTPTNIYIPQVESVPEELFRRYTDTDSRPQTPAPTLVSGITRLSTSRTRRCVTPDPVPTCQVKEKTRLILDLRRSHSQENLSIYGSSSFYPDLPKFHTQLPSSSTSVEELKPNSFNKQPNSKRPVSVKKKENALDQNNLTKNAQVEDDDDDEDEDNDEFIKRRGKRRRKKTRDSSRCPITYQASVEPETQVAAIGPDSHNASTRHSLAPDGCFPTEFPQEEVKKLRTVKTSDNYEIDSYLPNEILNQLRRELDDVTVDSELNSTKRKALEEALKAVLKDKPACDELIFLKKELKIPPVNSDLWISLPRTFSRSNAIFQLPMDSQTFAEMSPLDYVENNVKIISSRKLLYNCIFEKYKLEIEEENELHRQLDQKVFKDSLDLVIGHSLTEDQFNYIKTLLEWKEDIVLSFKMCCGIFALCERILSPQFCELPNRKEDPCHEIETADFEFLEQKLEKIEISDNLKTILLHLKYF
ncbi:unnamed protein product [Psylliodes chrysocephalus]|uniref:Uncharacterized protein n=1 Tax=Psylliodes chrysocephalus TaxID=3402493 RepID=A0A9P0CFE0_9CUCU|nr:unnamed protein product [Psylliodes chrysocephala]